MQVFLDLDFTLLEMNPFTLDAAGNPFPLDMRGELDDTAAFKSGKKCGCLSTAAPLGCTCTCPTKPPHRMCMSAALWGVGPHSGSTSYRYLCHLPCPLLCVYVCPFVSLYAQQVSSAAPTSAAVVA